MQRFERIMFSKIKRMVGTVTLSLIMVLLPYYQIYALTQPISYREEIRVGLYFKDLSKNINTQIDSFSIHAKMGLELGYEHEGNFEPVFNTYDNCKIVVCKESHYISKIKGSTEPFYVEIGNSYDSYSAAKIAAVEIGEKGVDAYPAYSGDERNGNSWRVLAGFYSDIESAEEDIARITNMEWESENQDKNQEIDFSVINPNSSNIVITSDTGEVITVLSTGKGSLQIHPSIENNPKVLNVNGNNYRGIIEVRRLQESDMTVINILPLEEYINGVVPCEIEWDSHPEALKAQAVAARTYALGNLGKYSTLGFDLCNTVSSQVYRGFDYERETTNKAVDDTKGKVIYYDGGLARVFYFSSSGGMTETAKNVWSSEIPYLQSVEDIFEAGNSYNYNWERTLTAAKISNIVASMGNNIGDILGIGVTKFSEGGRVLELVITGDKGEVLLEKSRCRDVLGLPSQWYDIISDGNVSAWNSNENDVEEIQLLGKNIITNKGLEILNSGENLFSISRDKSVKRLTVAATTDYIFRGKGYGHGVGMSQEGAKGMANAGFDFEEILTHYFVGTYIE